MVEALVARIRYHIQKANFMGLKEAESTLLLGEAADAIEELSVVVRAQKAVLDKFPKWIPVTEQTPDEYTTILFITGGGDLRVGYYDGDHKSYCDMTGFRYMCTHWMPAPQPPKEET